MKKRFQHMLLILLMLACMPLGTLAEASTTEGAAITAVAYNLWVVADGGSTIYRDSARTQPWVTLDEDTLVNLYAYGDGYVTLRNGDRFGYIDSGDIQKLEIGTLLCAKRDTRVYQEASLDSRHVRFQRGLSIKLVAIEGSCAKVERNGIIGYMYIGHLELVPESWTV